MGGQGRCERRIEVFEKIQKINSGGPGGRWGGGSGWLVVRVDVNAILGKGEMWGIVDVKPRIEGIVQCTKRYCTMFRKLKKMWGEGEGNI